MRRRGKSAFTLIELLVAIAVIAILAVFLFPAFALAREKARQSACLSNFKQIGTAVMMYLQDWDEVYPTCRLPMFPGGYGCASGFISWKHAVQPYVKNTGVYRCPSNPYKHEPDETKGVDRFGYTVFPISLGVFGHGDLGPARPE